MRRFCFLLLGSAVACQTIEPADPEKLKATIAGVVHQHQADLESCYLKTIEERPGADGKVLMAWTVEPDGHVSAATVKDAGPKIAGIAPCLTEKIKTWIFVGVGSEGGAVDVNYPFFFSENGAVQKR